MGLVKCPRCELNYIKEGEKYCNVCKRELKGEDAPEELLDICIECNENPVVPGESLCLYCLREKRQLESMDKRDDIERDMSPGLDLVDDDLQEIGIDDDEEIPPTELEEIDNELGIEEPVGLIDTDGDEEEEDEEEY